jgi:hypothetical protein
MLGLAAGAMFIALARRSHRENHVFAFGLLLAALIYVGFALYENATDTWRLIEFAGAAFYGVLALLGLYRSKLWLAAGWALHVLWDAGLHLSYGNLHAPVWYVWVCLSFDVVVAAYIARNCFNTTAVRQESA